MAYRSLRDFLKRLEKAGELVRVTEPVSSVLEMTEIHRRLIHEGGPAVLFENVIRADGARSAMPCLVNLFGTVRRVAMGVTLEGRERSTAADLREVGELLAFLRSPEPPRGMKEALDLLPLARTVMDMRPKTVARAPVQQVVWTGAEIDLGKLPVQTCWPGDAGPLITWGLTVTRGPTKPRQNLGIYRQQVIGPNRVIMRWLAHRGGALDYQDHRKSSKEKFPVAVAIGNFSFEDFR